MHIYLSENETSKVKGISYNSKVRFFIECLSVFQSYVEENSLEHLALNKVLSAFRDCFNDQTGSKVKAVLTLCTQIHDWVDFDPHVVEAIQKQHEQILEQIVESDRNLRRDCSDFFENL